MTVLDESISGGQSGHLSHHDALHTLYNALNLNGTQDGIDGTLIIEPDSDTTSGLIVKIPSDDYGELDGTNPDGAHTNAYMVLKQGTEVDPDDLILWRVNAMGSQGMTGGLHVATGLRQEELGPIWGRCIWVQPQVDITGSMVDLNAPPGFTGKYLTLYDEDVDLVFSILNDGTAAWYDDDGTTGVMSIQPGTTPPFGVRVLITAASATTTPLMLRAATGQSAPLQEFETIAGVGLINIGGDFAVNFLDDAGTGGAARIQAKTAPTNNLRAWFAAVGAAVVPLSLFPVSGQTADILRVDNFAGTGRLSRFDKNGTFITARVAAPADADLGNNELAIWSDDNSVNFKKKTAAGAIVTGEVALA